MFTIQNIQICVLRHSYKLNHLLKTPAPEGNTVGSKPLFYKLEVLGLIFSNRWGKKAFHQIHSLPSLF